MFIDESSNCMLDRSEVTQPWSVAFDVLLILIRYNPIFVATPCCSVVFSISFSSSNNNNKPCRGGHSGIVSVSGTVK